MKQRGVALLIVLMVVALVSILATEMGSRLQLQVSRAAVIKDNNQAYWYAMGAEQFARKSIEQLLKLDDDIIHANQPWTQEFTYPLEGGGIQAQLTDMQSCFNLNALRINTDDDSSAGNNESLNAFYDLLNKSELGIPSFNAETLRDSLADWLDGDSNLRSYGAEDSDYESLRFPYLSANNLMVSKSELRLVNGVDLAWLNQLMPLVCVIPDKDSLSLNINTLSDEQAPILAAATGLSVEDARSQISNRPSEGYKQVDQFLSQPEIAALNLSEDRREWFAVTTEYFILQTRTRYNNASFNMASLLKIDQNQRVAVVRREFGGVN